MPESFYRGLLDQMFEGVYFVDPDRRITYWNVGAETITGFSAKEVVGRRCADGILRHVNNAGKHLCLHGCPLAGVMRDGEMREARVYLHHKDGHRVPVTVRAAATYGPDGSIDGSVEIFTATATNPFATFDARANETDAMRDPLTGLGNRRFGELNLASTLTAVTAGDTPAGLLFLDIDHFKSVNDTHGHIVGDAVLRMVAQTVANGLRKTDIPIRWGGEEIIVILPGASPEATEATGERVRMLVENSWIDSADVQVRVTVSVGAAAARPGDVQDAWIERADRLMYAGKHGGRNLVVGEHGPVPRIVDKAPWPAAFPSCVPVVDLGIQPAKGIRPDSAASRTTA